MKTMITADEFAERTPGGELFDPWLLRNTICDLLREVERLERRVAELEEALTA